MKLLSICIPTYNRCDLLDSTLDKIFSIVDGDISVLVFDNASTDNTENMIKKYEKFELTYFRSEKNLGYDANHLRMIMHSKLYSKYSLWLGDDDCPLYEFFSDIPSVLDEKKPNLVLLNSYKYPSKYPYWQILRTHTVSSVQDLFANYFDCMTFGTIIVDNDLLSGAGLNNFMNTGHLYLGAIWNMLNDVNKQLGKIKVIITNRAYILEGCGDKTWKNEVDKVFMGVGRAMACLPEELMPIAYNTIVTEKCLSLFGKYADCVFDSFINEIKSDIE